MLKRPVTHLRPSPRPQQQGHGLDRSWAPPWLGHGLGQALSLASRGPCSHPCPSLVLQPSWTPCSKFGALTDSVLFLENPDCSQVPSETQWSAERWPFEDRRAWVKSRSSDLTSTDILPNGHGDLITLGEGTPTRSQRMGSQLCMGS